MGRENIYFVLNWDKTGAKMLIILNYGSYFEFTSFFIYILIF